MENIENIIKSNFKELDDLLLIKRDEEELYIMRIFKDVISIFVKKPLSTTIFGLIILMISIIEYEAILPLIYSFYKISNGNIFTSIVYIFKIIFNIIIHILQNPIFMLKFLGVVVGTGFVGGVIFSGYLYILNKYVNNSKFNFFDFIKGVRKYFFRYFFMGMGTVLYILIFALAVTVVSFPALVFDKIQADGSLHLIFVSIFTSAITLMVILFSYVFFISYISFWYASILIAKRSYFKNCKKIVDSNFNKISLKMLKFGLIYIIFEGLYIVLNYILTFGKNMNGLYEITQILINWGFNVFLVAAFILYVLRMSNIKAREIFPSDMKTDET